MGQMPAETESSMQQNAATDVLDRRLIVILLVVFVQIVGAAMVLPILPLYAKNQFGMSATSVTLLITAFFAAQFVAGPFIGRLSDRWGRIPVLLVSQIGTVISFLMLGFAPNVTVLFLARILDGITGGNIIVAQAYVTDITPREQRTQALGYIFAAFGVGFIVGPAIGGILAAQVSYVAPYVFAAGAAAVVVVMTWVFLEETVTDEQRQKSRDSKGSNLSFLGVLTNLPLLSILMIAFGAQFAFSMLQSTFALFGEAILFADNPGRAELGIGLLLATIGVGQIMTQLYLVKRLVKWFGESRLAFIGTVIRGISVALIVVVTTPWMAVLPLFLFAVGTGTQMPALQSLISNTVPDHQRGAVYGLYQSSISLSIIVGSAIAGTLFSIRPTMPYIVGALDFALLLIPMFFLMQWARSQEVAGQKANTMVVSGD